MAEGTRSREATRIIGLTGAKRSGKDTVARILVEEYGFTQLSFAGPLKEMARRIDPVVGWDGEELFRLSEALDWHNGSEDLVKDYYPEYRRFLQRLGTEGIREVEPEFWTELLYDEASKHDKVVVSDVRFPNEAKTIQNLGYHFDEYELWHIDASERLDASGDGHASESHAGNVGEDIVIHNNGSLFDLVAGVHYLMEDANGSR